MEPLNWARAFFGGRLGPACRREASNIRNATVDLKVILPSSAPGERLPIDRAAHYRISLLSFSYQ